MSVKLKSDILADFTHDFIPSDMEKILAKFEEI